MKINKQTVRRSATTRGDRRTGGHVPQLLELSAGSPSKREKRGRGRKWSPLSLIFQNVVAPRLSVRTPHSSCRNDYRRKRPLLQTRGEILTNCSWLAACYCSAASPLTKTSKAIIWNTIYETGRPACHRDNSCTVFSVRRLMCHLSPSK